MKHPLAIALLTLALSACGDEPTAPPSATPGAPAQGSAAATPPAAAPTVKLEMPLPTEDEIAEVAIVVQEALDDITPENAEGLLQELEMFIGADAMFYADQPGPADAGGGDGR